jgi:hypothetical protein
MNKSICPRCCQLKMDVHTCTPTPWFGKLEHKITELETDLAELGRAFALSEAKVTTLEAELAQKAQLELDLDATRAKMLSLGEFDCIGVIDAEGNVYPEPPDAGTQIYIKKEQGA